MKAIPAESKEVAYRIHKAVFLLDKLSEQVLQARLGLGLSQFLVMKALADEPRVPQKRVASSLDQTQAAVSRQVDILVGLGLVERRTNPDNRREYVLSLTKLGRARFREGQRAIDARLDRIFAIWTAREKAGLVDALDTLAAEIRAKSE